MFSDIIQHYLKESTMNSSEQYHLYLDTIGSTPELEAQFPEVRVLKMLGLYENGNASTWMYQIGMNEEWARMILSGLELEGRYPAGVEQAAAGRVRHAVVRGKQKIEDGKSIWRGVKKATKAIATIEALEESGSLLQAFAWLGAMHGLWWLIDQVMAYPEEQLIAQGTIIPIALQRAFLLPIERKPIDPENIVQLIAEKPIRSQQPTIEGMDTYRTDLINKTSQWIDRFNGLINRGVAISDIYKLVKKRYPQWPTAGSVEKAEWRVIGTLITQLGSLPGSASVEEVMVREAYQINSSRAERMRIVKGIKNPGVHRGL